MKTRHRFSPFMGVLRDIYWWIRTQHQSKWTKSDSSSGIIGATFRASRRRRVWGGRNLNKGKKEWKGFPRPPLALELVKSPFLTKDGGAIYDWFLKLILRGSFAMSGLNTVNYPIRVVTSSNFLRYQPPWPQCTMTPDFYKAVSLDKIALWFARRKCML
jgi:hypothetical protein